MTTEPVTACVHINAPPERVYQYFTRPEALLSWMGDHALLEAEPGGRFDLDIKGTPVRGRYLHLDPPHRLLISWGYAGSDHLPPGASTVEVRLTADRGGTLVELEHRDLPDGERPAHASGWTHYLARLQADRGEVLAARHDVPLIHYRRHGAQGGHAFGVVEIHALGALQEHEVPQRLLAELDQR